MYTQYCVLSYLIVIIILIILLLRSNKVSIGKQNNLIPEIHRTGPGGSIHNQCYPSDDTNCIYHGIELY